MKRLFRVIGRLVYLITYPILAFLLSKDERVRVVIRCGDDILLVKSWLSSGQWDLPGGGIHKNEKPQQAAIREVFEELAIRINPEDMKPIAPTVYKSGLISYKAHFFNVELPKKPSIKMQKFEISDAVWIPKNEAALLNLHPHLIDS